MKKFLPYIAIVLSMLIWSVSGIAIKTALVSFSSISLLVMRFSLAILVLLLIGLAFRHNALLALQRLDKKDIPLFLLAGFFQPCIYYLLETYTYDALSSPTIAETLLSTNPVLAPVFAWLILRERVTLYNIAGILISTEVMLMVVLIGTDNFALGNPWGILTAILAVSTAVLYSVVLRRIPAQYNSLTIVFYVQLCALFLFYPMWIVQEGLHFPLPTDAALWTADFWCSVGAMTYLALFSTVSAFILFCYSVRQIGVTRGNVFNNVRPVFTALVMLFFFGEHLPFGKIVGGILIIVGLFISQMHTHSLPTSNQTRQPTDSQPTVDRQSMPT